MLRVIEALRARNQKVPVPLSLPSEDDLVLIEEQLYLTLNRELRVFLLTVSDLILGKFEPVTAVDEFSHTFLPTVAAEAWDQGVPRNLIPICQDGQKYFCIDETGEVSLWQGEQQTLDQGPWPDIWQWAESVWLSQA